MTDETTPTRDEEPRGGTADLLAGRGEADEPDRTDDQRPLDDDAAPAPLMDPDESSGYDARWQSIQAAFVDEPRHAVQDADALVADLMRQLAETFADERSRLESQWSAGDDVSTEDLRVAMQRYRSFFRRLLETSDVHAGAAR